MTPQNNRVTPNDLQVFNDGYKVGIWFVSTITFVISLFVILINWYTGWLGILATGFVDFAEGFDVWFAGVLAFTIIVNNLTLGYRVDMVWKATGHDGFIEALWADKSMRILSFLLAISYLADTATQVYAVVGTDYSVPNVILSTLFSLFCFTILAEVLFTTSLGILFGNWPYVKPLLTKMVLSGHNNQQANTPNNHASNGNNQPVFPTQHNQQNNQQSNQQNRGGGRVP